MNGGVDRFTDVEPFVHQKCWSSGRCESASIEVVVEECFESDASYEVPDDPSDEANPGAKVSRVLVAVEDAILELGLYALGCS